MEGWIKDYRKELESDIWMMPPLYHRVWQYLKYMANYEDKTIPLHDGGHYTIKSGQHWTSYRNIADGVSWVERNTTKKPSLKTIKNILTFLVNQNMIKIETPKGNASGTLVTIVNWEFYQSKDGERKHLGNTKETLRKQNKNDKNEKNDKEVINNNVGKKFPDDHKATVLTKLLVKMMLQNNPNARIPKTEKQKERWIDALEKIHRLDGYSYDQIKKAIIWSQNNDFWKSNILSTKKLREKMPTLILQMERNQSKSQSRPMSRYERTVSELDRLYQEAIQSEQSRSH